MGRTYFFAVVLFALSIYTAAGFTDEAVAEDELQRTSPLFTEYNTFINTANFLELLSVGSGTASVKISIFRQDGSFQKAVRVDVPSMTQTDVDINTLVGNTNTYGVIMVEFNTASAELQGRMALYRPNTDGTFSFAYTLPLRAPTTGTSYSTANTHDPQGRGFIVGNWVSITNLDDTAQTFTYNRYDQGGVIVRTDVVTLDPNGRFDLSGGHESGQGVFLNEIIPSDNTAPYLSAIIRYASNSTTGSTNSYAFATPIFSRAGSTEEQFLPVFDESGECFTQSNWVEVVNVTNAQNSVNVVFRDPAGAVFQSTTLDLSARSQFHLFASAVLEDRELTRGTVSVDGVGGVIAQSVVYYHDCSSNRLHTAYNVQAEVPRSVPVTGSYNTFIDIQNELFVAGARGVQRNVDLELRSNGDVIHSSRFTLNNFASTVLNLNDESFGTTADTYGLITADTVPGDTVFGHNLRVRRSGANDSEIDFAVPIPLR